MYAKAYNGQIVLAVFSPKVTICGRRLYNPTPETYINMGFQEFPDVPGHHYTFSIAQHEVERLVPVQKTRTATRIADTGECDADGNPITVTEEYLEAYTEDELQTVTEDYVVGELVEDDPVTEQEPLPEFLPTRFSKMAVIDAFTHFGYLDTIVQIYASNPLLSAFWASADYVDLADEHTIQLISMLGDQLTEGNILDLQRWLRDNGRYIA